MDDITDTVRRLADLEAIRDLARRYAHHVWQRQPLEAVALFARDGVMDLGADGRIEGIERLRAVYGEKVAGDSLLQPYVHNHVITLDGDRASGVCYLDLRCRRDGQSLIGAGFYEDRYVREDGVWKFAIRRLELCYLVPAGAEWQQP